MAARQAPLSLGISRQEHWSGLPFPSPMHESENEVTQSRLTLSDPMDCSLPGSSIHGIFQARVLEWGAIAFSVTDNRGIQRIIRHNCKQLYVNLDDNLEETDKFLEKYNLPRLNQKEIETMNNVSQILKLKL